MKLEFHWIVVIVDMDILVDTASSLLGSSPDGKNSAVASIKRPLERKETGELKRIRSLPPSDWDCFDVINRSPNHIRSKFIRDHYYSSLDNEYFRNNEFMLCLKHINCDQWELLNRSDWNKIRALMSEKIGRPRRLSMAFLKRERARLHEYRLKMREIHQTIRKNGSSGAFHGNISVGDRVNVCDFPNKKIYSGTVLSLGNKDNEAFGYFVQFDNRDLDRKWVSDLDISMDNSETSPKNTETMVENGLAAHSNSNISKPYSKSSNILESDFNSELKNTTLSMDSSSSTSLSTNVAHCYSVITDVWPKYLSESENSIQEVLFDSQSRFSLDSWEQVADSVQMLMKSCMACFYFLRDSDVIQNYTPLCVLIALTLKVCENCTLQSDCNSTLGTVTDEIESEQVKRILSDPSSRLLFKYLKEAAALNV